MTPGEREHIESQFSEVKVILNRLDDAIRGNGQPGLVLRIDRLERSRALHNKALWAFMVAGVGILTQWIRSFWS